MGCRHLEEKKTQARALIYIGATLRETSQKTGLSINQVKKMSTKENLIEKREKLSLELLQEFYNEKWETIKANKDKRLELNTKFLYLIEREIDRMIANNEPITKYFMELLMLNEEIEQKILQTDYIAKHELTLRKMELQELKCKNKLEILKSKILGSQN